MSITTELVVAARRISDALGRPTVERVVVPAPELREGADQEADCAREHDADQ